MTTRPRVFLICVSIALCIQRFSFFSCYVAFICLLVLLFHQTVSCLRTATLSFELFKNHLKVYGRMNEWKVELRDEWKEGMKESVCIWIVCCLDVRNVGIWREACYIYSQCIGKAGLQTTPNCKGTKIMKSHHLPGGKSQ